MPYLTNKKPHPDADAAWRSSTVQSRLDATDPSTAPLRDILHAQAEKFRSSGFKRSRYSSGHVPLFHGRNIGRHGASPCRIPPGAGILIVDLDEVDVKFQSLKGRAGSFIVRDRDLEGIVCIEMKYEIGDFVAVWLADRSDPEIRAILDSWERGGAAYVVLKEGENYVLRTVPIDLPDPLIPMTNMLTSDCDERSESFMTFASEIARSGEILLGRSESDESIFPRRAAVNVLLSGSSAPLAVGKKYFDAYDRLESFIDIALEEDFTV